MRKGGRILLPIINRDCMVFDLDVENKQQALEKMVDIFDEQGYLNNKELFLEDVIEREKVFSTFLDYGIGLPHGKSNGTNQAGVCIARLKNPVSWNENVEDKVDIVIMIAVKADNDNDLHLKILAKLSRALMHKEFRDILKEGSEEQVYDNLIKQLEV